MAIDIEGIRCCPGETEHSGPLADLTRLHTTILFVLGRRGHAGSFIDFTQARMSVLWDHENSWSGHHDVLKGLQYEAIHMADVNPENRLKWMSESSHYSRSVDSENLGKRVYLRGAPAPQPYNQLASAYRSAGDDAKARTVLLRKHQDSAAFRDQSQGATVRFFLAAWNRLQDYTFGYGYRPFRAFCSLLAIWAAGVFIFYWHPPIPASPDQGSQSATNVQLEMNWADHLAYPADRIIPFANLMEDHWVPSDDITTFIAYTLTVLGWIFSAVVIAGVTRFLKRE
ncbi:MULTISPECIES: hypothetical protein [unclassified Streptomyces]|uniref:hypothetical protein n=1 Tax=unclassified Streptomyces TaxID=2593676 RepID=UPI0033D99EE0